MNWAWQQSLSPNLKLILMALSDAADDDGICWPSVSTIATKCNVSTRTVRRGLQSLIETGLLMSEPRYRNDGSNSSNRYRLQLGGGDKLSPTPDSGVRPPGHVCQGPPDNRVTPGTTTGIVNESPPLPNCGSEAQLQDRSAGGGGNLFVLEYPRALSQAECDEARVKLAGLSQILAQQLLDELAASMKKGVIKTTPLAYLRGLVKRARAGTYTPEGALAVSNQRRRKAEVDAALTRSGKSNEMPIESVDPDNPLVKKLRGMQQRSKGPGREQKRSMS